MTTRRKPLPSTTTFPEHDRSNALSQSSQNAFTRVHAIQGYEQVYATDLSKCNNIDDSGVLSYYFEHEPNSSDSVVQNTEASDYLNDRAHAEIGVDGTHHGVNLLYESTSIFSPEGVEDAVSIPSTSSRARLKLVTALEDTSQFLGGLIRHPVESNKHFTILRHSHGLVYYKGPETSLAMSIFADSPLPRDRRLWLQLKGWTGGSGMRMKALLRANASWCNVTPDRQVEASDLPALDERAWQRDIHEFVSKADKTQRTHALRETVIVRIPYEANDGYFRIVLTAADSRKVLCPSPVFRVASTSMSASSLKGASLTTLPVELGVKVAQMAAKTATINAAAPLALAVKSQISSAVPLSQYTGHARTAWDVSGAQDQMDKVNNAYHQREAEQDAPEISQMYKSEQGLLISSDDGPKSPFPLRLQGTISPGTGKNREAFGMPTANLDVLPSDLIAPLVTGVYFGWAFVLASDRTQQEIHEDWRQTIVNVMHTSTEAQIAQRKVIRAYLVHDFPDGTSFVSSKLKLVVMGYLRPLAFAQEKELALFQATNDLYVADASLSRPAWQHEAVLERIKTNDSTRSMTDRMVDLRISGQRRADTIPLHKLGYRSDSVGLHDRGVYGNGGLFVKRDIG